MTNRQHLKAARIFARLMDSQFSIFGIGIGLDGLIGLIPWAGDILSMILSLYLVWIGVQMKLPQSKIFQMILNIVIDAVIGFIPVFGDVADILYQANIRNLRILEKHVGPDEVEIIEGEVIL
jgi:hypothetical protein